MYKKLFQPRIWKRIYLERLGEPLIYNIVAVFIFFFGSFRKKIEYDLISREPYDFGVDKAFSIVRGIEGKKRLVLIEFGVAQGAGLQNLVYLSKRLSIEHGIDVKIAGFDSGKGMPTPVDYRDHPEKYYTGDYPMLCKDDLIRSLPNNVKLYLGDIEETLESFISELGENDIVAFVSVDVDYYSSTIKCLKLLKRLPLRNLPSSCVMYLDDINNIDHNEFCGELLAVKEFNDENTHRKITPMNNLRSWRIFKNTLWADQMFFLHVLEHEKRSALQKNKKLAILSNPFLES